MADAFGSRSANVRKAPVRHCDCRVHAHLWVREIAQHICQDGNSLFRIVQFTRQIVVRCADFRPLASLER